MKIQHILIVCIMFFVTGCASVDRRSPHFDATLPTLKTIAILPADVKVYQLSAGGVSEEMDEWSNKARGFIEESLKKQLGDGLKYPFQLKFITQDWMKTNYAAQWRSQKALYEAVALSVMRHTYNPMEKFSQKVEKFDYTLGPDLQTFANQLGVDGFIFVNASDTQQTMGHKFSNFMQAVIVGYYTIHPSFFCMSLVDGKTGDLLWFKIAPGQQDYNFLNPKHIDSLVRWVTSDLITPKK